MSLFDNRYPEAADIVVGTLSDAKSNYRHFQAVISIEDVGFDAGLRIPPSEKTDHLVLSFDDIEYSSVNGRSAQEKHLRYALEFARKHEDNMLYIHCHAGQCRSPAIALAVIADRMGPGREAEAVDALKVVRRWATPNKLVVELADKVLGRKGALVEALNAGGNKLTRLGSVTLLKTNASHSAWPKPRFFSLS